MDLATSKYYKNNAYKLYHLYQSVKGGISFYFLESFRKNSKILDVGCGSGRDLGVLLNLGYDAFGVEPCEDLVNLSISKNPLYKKRILNSKLPSLPYPFGGEFDGILCSAVLMHIPEKDLGDSLIAFKINLKIKGRLLLSIPVAREDVIDSRDRDGRLYVLYNPETISLLLEKIGFKKLNQWKNQDGLGRDFYWWVLLFELDRKND